MNFAQMEMRVLLASILRRFTLEVAAPTAGVDPLSFAINRPILRPRDGIFLNVIPRADIDPTAPLKRAANVATAAASP